MNDRPDTIIITSDEPYSKMWHTQMIYCSYLSAQCNVIFIDPPAAWSIKNLFRGKKEQSGKNLTIYPYRNLLPSALPFGQKVNERINSNAIFRLLKTKDSKSVLIWHFDSYRSLLLKIKYTGIEIRRIYHVIDPFYNNPLNKQLCELADLVVLTS